MVVIWDIIKKTAMFGWEEIIYLVIYNIVALTVLAGGPALVIMGITISPLLMMLGSILLFLTPPVLFGLFWLTYQISLGNAVKFSTFWDGAKQHRKTAYIWGGINLVIIVTLVANIIFYQQQKAVWAGYIVLLFIGLLLVAMAVIGVGGIVLGTIFTVVLGLFSVSLAALVSSITVQELIKISRGEA